MPHRDTSECDISRGGRHLVTWGPSASCHNRGESHLTSGGGLDRLSASLPLTESLACRPFIAF